MLCDICSLNVLFFAYNGYLECVMLLFIENTFKCSEISKNFKTDSEYSIWYLLFEKRTALRLHFCYLEPLLIYMKIL